MTRRRRHPRARCSPPMRRGASAPTRTAPRRFWRARVGAPRTWCEAVGTRPVLAHDAKSLGQVPATLAHDTEVAAYLLEPARRAYPFRELCEERGPGRRRRGPRGRRRTARPRARRLAAGGDSRSRTDRPAERRRAAAGPRPAQDGAGGIEAGHRAPGRDLGPRQGRGRRARARDLRTVGRGVHARLAQAARGDPVRQARPVAQAPRQDRVLDRRPRTPGDPRRARGDPQDRALAGADQARADLSRRTAPADRVGRAAAHHVQSDSRHHRAAVVEQPKSAEHPDPYRARPRDPGLLRGGAGESARLRRLLSGRAEVAGAHRRRGRC